MADVSVAGLRDLVTVKTAQMLHHPAYQQLRKEILLPATQQNSGSTCTRWSTLDNATADSVSLFKPSSSADLEVRDSVDMWTVGCGRRAASTAVDGAVKGHRCRPRSRVPA